MTKHFRGTAHPILLATLWRSTILFFFFFFFGWGKSERHGSWCTSLISLLRDLEAIHLVPICFLISAMGKDSLWSWKILFIKPLAHSRHSILMPLPPSDDLWQLAQTRSSGMLLKCLNWRTQPRVVWFSSGLANKPVLSLSAFVPPTPSKPPINTSCTEKVGLRTSDLGWGEREHNSHTVDLISF